MAGDLDLTRVTAALPVDTVKEVDHPQLDLEQKSFDQTFDRPDAAPKRRKAFEEALEDSEYGKRGKLVIEQDEETGRFVQKLMDPNTGDVIRQWPEEEFLELAKAMGEAYGLFVDQNV